jgi:tRNA 2-thiouridine synthesizing protein A
MTVESKTTTGSVETFGVPDMTIDITGEICPMTFVRTRLALDRLASGHTLLVLLKGDEPVANVPRTAAEQGHTVLAMETGADGISRLLLLRK